MLVGSLTVRRRRQCKSWIRRSLERFSETGKIAASYIFLYFGEESCGEVGFPECCPCLGERG